MSSYQLMVPGVRSSQVFSGFGLKPPVSGFRSYSYSSLKILHLYSTNDKTSRLMMKSFSTVRDTQRGSQSYMEKRRGRRELEVMRMSNKVQGTVNFSLFCVRRTPRHPSVRSLTEPKNRDGQAQRDKLRMARANRFPSVVPFSSCPQSLPASVFSNELTQIGRAHV